MIEEQDDVLSQFESERRTGIGATDTPKILGLSPRGTPLSVYREKIGEAEPGASSLPAWLGQKMQATVAELYTARTGNRVRAARQHYRHKEHDWLVCHLDYRVQGEPNRLVECKTRAYTAGWGEEGSDKIPPDVWAQAQHEMLVVGAQFCDVAVLFGHHTFRVYTVPRDDVFLAALLPKLEQFWHAHVLAEVPPEPIGSDIDEAIVRRRYPTETEPVKAATPEQAAVAAQFLLARYNAKQAAAAEQAMKIRVIDIIGPAEGLQGAFGTITYRKSRDSQDTAWDLVARSYRQALETIMQKRLGGEDLNSTALLTFEDLDAIVSMYTETKEGSRRIDVREVKEDARVAS